MDVESNETSAPEGDKHAAKAAEGEKNGDVAKHETPVEKAPEPAKMYPAGHVVYTAKVGASDGFSLPLLSILVLECL